MNLRNVPEAERPPQEALEVDYDPWEGMDVEAWRREEQERRNRGSRDEEGRRPRPAPLRVLRR